MVRSVMTTLHDPPRVSRFAFLVLVGAVASCGGGNGGGTPAGYGGGASGGTTGAGGSAGGRDSGAIPTQGALHLTWTLQQGGSAVTCAQVAGQAGVSVLLTPSGSTSSIQRTLPCEPGGGDVTGIPFGGYTVTIDLINSQSLSLGSAPAQSVTLAASPCDRIVSGDCAKNLSVTVVVQ